MSNLKTILSGWALLALLFPTNLRGQGVNQAPPIPVDTAVRIGKLPNGLTYYIRHNNWPEHRADFYIAQKVGSIQEEESQRGLAHFLEHMCFNGTKHFPGNELIRYLETLGVKFGGDLNAYTSIDQSYINSGRVPLMKNDVTSLKDSANLMAYSLYTTGGDASSIAGYFPQGATPSAPAASKMESYKPLFIATDYSQPADGVYITVQPMGADQTMTFKFVSSGTGYAPASIFTGEAVM